MTSASRPLQLESRRRPRPGGGARGYLIYAFVFATTLALLPLTEPDLFHWFMFPVVMCGVLLSKDAADWLSGRKDPFDPKAILGILGIHLFVLAPIFIVMFDHEYDAISRDFDWRPWLGAMAWLNLLGLICYQVCSTAMSRVRRRRRPKRWQIDDTRLYSVLVPALAISALAQMYLWVRFGGVSGQIESYRGESAATGRFKFQLFANAFPILLLIALTTLRSRYDRLKGNYSVAFVILIAVFVLYFILDGLRGSRSSIVWTLFWAAGIVHYFWRRMSSKLLVLGLIPLMAFMYVYGFYKSYRSDFIEEYEQSSGLTELSERTGRTFKRMLVSDLSRSDVQAFLVYRLYADDSEYRLRYGNTYLETIPRSLLPSWLWSGRSTSSAKVLAGTELQYGSPNSRFVSSKVYGLAGEGMLNFHIFGVLPAFCLFGLVLGWYRRQLVSWDPYDARFYIAPLAANWFVAALIGDFDNLVTFTLAKGVFPLFVLLLMSKRRRTS